MFRNISHTNYTKLHTKKFLTQITNNYDSNVAIPLIVQLEKVPEKLCGIMDCFSSKGMAILDLQFSFSSQYSISCVGQNHDKTRQPFANKIGIMALH